MITGVVFGRRATGGRGSVSATSDLLVTRIRDEKKGESMHVRIHGDAMKRQRWIVGDYIVFVPGDEECKSMTIERVVDAKLGIKITTASGKGSSHGRASFTLDSKVLDQIFLGENSFTATLCDGSGNKAVFLRD
jgi:hypothetical protein